MENLKYKLLFIDLDGTALNSNGVISDETKDALKSYTENGGRVFICSGRSLQSVMSSKLKELLDVTAKPDADGKMSAIGIFCNGSLIMDTNGNILQKSCMDMTAFEELVKFARDNKIHLNMYPNGLWHVDSAQLVSPEVMGYSNISKILIPQTLNYQDLLSKKNQSQYCLASGENIEKIKKNIVKTILLMSPTLRPRDCTCKSTTESQYIRENYLPMAFCSNCKKAYLDEQERIKQELNKIKAIRDNCCVVTSLTLHLEVIPKFSNKGVAMAKVAEFMGLTTKDCLAFGDGENDLEMLKMAGRGYAMKNALENVIANASHITEYSNDNNGVAYELWKLGVAQIHKSKP